MTPEQFNRLDDFKKLDLVWEHGSRISITADKRYRYILFRIENIYVEMKFEKEIPGWPRVRSFTNIIDTSALLHPEDNGGSAI
jgi:hypothetical protein